MTKEMNAKRIIDEVAEKGGKHVTKMKLERFTAVMYGDDIPKKIIKEAVNSYLSVYSNDDLQGMLDWATGVITDDTKTIVQREKCFDHAHALSIALNLRGLLQF